ncbi:GDP-L-fucose synthase family protein [Endozoicomonadaceae bacterium StTr2]
MKIFLTGGTGMVGRNIRALADRKGFQVDAPASQTLNLMDYEAVRLYLENSCPDVVIHSAGLVGGIQANIAAPYDFALINMQIGCNVVRAANELGIERLINFGSSCMYPREAENPLQESVILTGELEPTNEGYAIAKVAVARLAQYANSQFGRQYKTIIPCNLYGYWDKFAPEKSHMIPAVIRKIHEAKQASEDTVEIWGDGTARREFMFAEDLAEFTLFMLNKLEQAPELINAGLGHDYSINEYYQAIAEIVGYQGRFVHDLTKPVGMKQKLVDTSLQSEMGWKPRHSLKQGLSKTYQFYLEEVI